MGLDGKAAEVCFLRNQCVLIDLTKVQKIQEVFDQESNVNPAKD